jgi:hypothetical protein
MPKNFDGTQPRGLIEIEHDVIKYRRYLPADVLPDGSVRKEDLIQFYSKRGWLRTVAARDLII